MKRCRACGSVVLSTYRDRLDRLWTYCETCGHWEVQR